MYSVGEKVDELEWSKSFIGCARTLPYAQELIFLDELSEKSGR